MDFLQRHAFYLVCGLVGAGGIALAVTGVSAMPKVKQRMEESKRLYDQLSSIQAQPVNQRCIDVENQRINLTKTDRAKVVEHIKEKVYRYSPLIDGVFPEGSDEARRRFRSAYEKAMWKLFDTLRSGMTAGEAELKIMKDKIENEKALAKDSGRDFAASGPPRTPAGFLTEAGIRLDPVARANVAVAQRIYCYAIPFLLPAGLSATPSLDFHPAMRDTGTMDAPYPEEVWRAQVGYWIQKDVVDAIVAVNEGAAAEALQRGENIWVGVIPVKDVISIRVSDYVVEDEAEFVGASPGGYELALPCATANTVFTGSLSGELYDVVQFTLKLVMDQRDIPRLVERLSQSTFHTPLRVAHVHVVPSRDMNGKIYGSEPAVNVVMDFETIMLAEVFRPWMPEVVCERYEFDCAPYKEEE